MTRGELIDALCAADRQPSAENVRLLHELQVHQVELEMQNKQLRDAQQQLEESRGRYADLFDLAPVAYCVFDRNGTIEDANLAAAALLRMNRSALIGLPFSRVVTIAEKQTFSNHVSRCFDEELRVTSELTVGVRGRGELVLQAVSTPFLDGATGRTKACRTTLNDITRLKRSEGTFRFLAGISEALSSSLDVKATLNAIVKACVPMLADACFVDLCDGDDYDAPLRRVDIQLASPNAEALDLLRRHAYDPAWRKYEAQLVTTLTPVFEPASAAALGATLESQLGARALLLLPLVGVTRTLGVLGALMSHSGRAYSLQDFELAQDVARRAAMALDNALAYEQVRELVDGPARSERQEPLTPPQLVAAAASQPRPVLIVLDRDDESRAAMRDALESRGFAVIDTDDAQHTAKYLHATATPPLAVIADERVIEGQDHAPFRSSRVIVIGPKARTGELGRTFGAVACFEKPVSIDELLASIGNQAHSRS